MTTESAYCGKYGVEIQEPTNAKPDLPGMWLDCAEVRIGITATVSLKSKLGYSAKHPSGKKPYAEGVSGDELHQKSGEWMKKERLIDRKKDQ
jgi:hypothetical protein